MELGWRILPTILPAATLRATSCLAIIAITVGEVLSSHHLDITSALTYQKQDCINAIPRFPKIRPTHILSLHHFRDSTPGFSYAVITAEKECKYYAKLSFNPCHLKHKVSTTKHVAQILARNLAGCRSKRKVEGHVSMV